MAFHKKAAEIYREHAFSGGAKTDAAIAVFLDDELYCEVIPNIARPVPVGSQTSGSQLTKNLGYVGAPYHMYLLSDLPLVRPDDYKMALLISPSHWNEERLAALEQWKKGDRVIAVAGKGQEELLGGITFDAMGWRCDPFTG